MMMKSSWGKAVEKHCDGPFILIFFFFVILVKELCISSRGSKNQKTKVINFRCWFHLSGSLFAF